MFRQALQRAAAAGGGALSAAARAPQQCAAARRLFGGLQQPAPPYAEPAAQLESVTRAQLSDPVKLRHLIERQIQLETTALEKAVDRYKTMAERTTDRFAGSTLPAAKRLIVRWFTPLVESIRTEQEKCKKRDIGVDRRNYADVLTKVKAEELAVITLHCVLNLLMKGENFRAHDEEFEEKLMEAGVVKTVKAVTYIGDVLFAQIQMKERRRPRAVVALGLDEDDAPKWQGRQPLAPGRKLQHGGRESKKLVEDVDKIVDEMRALLDESEPKLGRPLASSTQPMDVGDNLSVLARQEAIKEHDDDARTRLKTGAVLLHLLMQSCTVNVPGQTPGEMVIEPAFYTHYATGPEGRRYGTVAWHESVLQMIGDSNIVRMAMQPRYLPMLVPSRPWVRYDQGAYLQLESMVMRGGYTRIGPSNMQLEQLNRAQQEQDTGTGPGLQAVFKALNVLGQTPWRINLRVLEVMEEAWNRLGGGVAGLPPREDLFIPLKPRQRFGAYRRVEVVGRSRKLGSQLLVFGHFSENEVVAHRRTVRKVRQKNRELQSQRCDFVYKLQVAKDLRNEEAFYFPHNLDFRGRAYPMHPHLNHLGADNCRGLLMFADARPLGPHGLRWLFIQAANLYATGGVDKLPLDEREAFMRGHLPDLLLSADDPLGKDRFWMQAEDPWQFLAACVEIAAAVRSPDPTAYMSRLPCHQDGSCNGLQHYAALGRDMMGAKAVNLVPGDRPGDVYTGIAQLLVSHVKKDTKSASAEKARLAADILPYVNRKLVKQTVMTSVYGVTLIGARMQIQNRLKERGVFKEDDTRYKVACYAARATLSALNDMFTNARNVMDWLASCASIIAASGKCVRWRTPLGLPVVQPYRKKTKGLVRTVLQTFAIQAENESKPVTKMKQRTAFPPNYIHSLDSSHMMLTAIGCHEAGLTFAGVHDSFWTHACTVPEMGRILREKFVELHSEPLLQTLYEGFQREYPDVKDQLPPPPTQGEMDIGQVLKSTYFFS